jgi:hypothetical protein
MDLPVFSWKKRDLKFMLSYIQNQKRRAAKVEIKT